MKIDHIAMYVEDLEGARDFFCKYFGATAGELYYNEKKGFKSFFLTFEDGARLELMWVATQTKSIKWIRGTGYNHLSFSVGSKEAVDQLTERLRADGYWIYSDPRTTGDGYYESVIVDKEENVIEITA